MADPAGSTTRRRTSGRPIRDLQRELRKRLDRHSSMMPALRAEYALLVPLSEASGGRLRARDLGAWSGGTAAGSPTSSGRWNNRPGHPGGLPDDARGSSSA